eukprot:7450444-Alexandrium_andersonii.AAC.1
MSAAPSRRASTSLVARWLAPESTTHGAGRSFERSSLARTSSSPGFATDSKRTHKGRPGAPNSTANFPPGVSWGSTAPRCPGAGCAPP